MPNGLSVLARGATAAAVVVAPWVVHAVLADMTDIPPSARNSLIGASALSHGTLYLGILLLFAQSLRPGQEALVSRLARRVEPCPTPALLTYARAVTWLWAGFSAAQIAGSATLLALAPLPVWSAFVNLLDAPLVGLVFVAEYGVRRWRFRHTRLATLTETVRAFTRRDAVPS